MEYLGEIGDPIRETLILIKKGKRLKERASDPKGNVP